MVWLELPEQVSQKIQFIVLELQEVEDQTRFFWPRGVGKIIYGMV